PDGRLLTAKCGDRICVWEIPSGKQVLDKKIVKDGVNILSLDPTGKRLLVEADHPYEVWDVQSGAVQLALDGLASVCFSPDGNCLSATFYGEREEHYRIEIHDLISHTPRAQIDTSP